MAAETAERAQDPDRLDLRSGGEAITPPPIVVVQASDLPGTSAPLPAGKTPAPQNR